MFQPENSTFITYDDEQSLRLKAEYIRANKLGGVMIWELSQDHQINLLNTLYTALKDPIADKTSGHSV